MSLEKTVGGDGSSAVDDDSTTLGGTARTVKSKEQPRPTFEQFVAQCADSFAFLSEFGFEPAPIPQRKFINEFQVRFTNEKLLVISEGINWGYGVATYFEDSAGVRVPLVLFVPRDQRKVHAEPLPGEPQQLVELRTAAHQVSEHCVDLLRGDMTRFYDRAAEWKRMTERDRSYQKRVLP
jgi:hypothetical protein